MRTRPGGETLELTYDEAAELSSITREDGSTLTLRRDALGRVIEESDGDVTRRWAWAEAAAPAALLNEDGSVATRFIYGTRAWVPDLMIRGEVTYRLIRDQRESVRAVVNTATGEIVQSLDYDIWGRTTRDTAPGFQPFGFTGGMPLAGTGLVRLGARLYDPEAGRWTTPDPEALGVDELNPYQYAGSDPVSLIDPTGYWPSFPNPIDVMADAVTNVGAAATGFVDDFTGGLASGALSYVLPGSAMDALCDSKGYDVGRIGSLVTSVVPVKFLAKKAIGGVAGLIGRLGAGKVDAARDALKNGRATAKNVPKRRGKQPETDVPSPTRSGGKGPQGPRKKSDGGPDAPPVRPKKQDSGKPGGNPKKSEACQPGRFNLGRLAGRAASCGEFGSGTDWTARNKAAFGARYDGLSDAKLTPRVHHTIPRAFDDAFAKIDIHHPCLTTALGKAAHSSFHGFAGGRWNRAFERLVEEKLHKRIGRNTVAGQMVDEIDPSEMGTVLDILDEMSELPELSHPEFAHPAYENGGRTTVPMNHRSPKCQDVSLVRP